MIGRKRFVLEGRRTLLTGASSGIGAILAKELAKRGAELVLSARRGELLDQLAAEIENAGGTPPLVLEADLSVRGQAEALATRAGEIDLLINNAGVAIGGTQWTVADRDEARRLLEVNYWSALGLISAIVPTMRSRGSGMVVNIASLGAVAPVPLIGHYEASKAALQQTSDVLRNELKGTGVRVLLVMPAFVDTPMIEPVRAHWSANRFLRMFPPVPANKLALAITEAIVRGKQRLVYPRRLWLPAAVPALGRWVTGLASHPEAGSETQMFGAERPRQMVR